MSLRHRQAKPPATRTPPGVKQPSPDRASSPDQTFASHKLPLNSNGGVVSPRTPLTPALRVVVHHVGVGPLPDLADCGDIVDPFLGSGSTSIAADKTGRVCRGVERDPLYVM